MISSVYLGRGNSTQEGGGSGENERKLGLLHFVFFILYKFYLQMEETQPQGGDRSL